VPSQNSHGAHVEYSSARPAVCLRLLTVDKALMTLFMGCHQALLS